MNHAGAQTGAATVMIAERAAAMILDGDTDVGKTSMHVRERQLVEA